MLVNLGSQRLQEAAHYSQPNSTFTDVPCSHQWAENYFHSILCLNHPGTDRYFSTAHPFMVAVPFTLLTSCDFVAQVQEPGQPRQQWHTRNGHIIKCDGFGKILSECHAVDERVEVTSRWTSDRNLNVVKVLCEVHSVWRIRRQTGKYVGSPSRIGI